MAIYLNGIKVSGRGVDGLSPYQVAVNGGYEGTEQDFNAQLTAIGVAYADFNKLQEQVKNTKAEVDAAVEQAEHDINAAIEQAEQDIDAAINSAMEATNNAQAVVDQAIIDINTAKEDALNSIPDSDNLVLKSGSVMIGYLTLPANPAENLHAATKQYVDEKTASIVTDIWYTGSSAPENTKLLWIDTTEIVGGLKYYNGSSWVHVPVAWQ